jgi:hypothetical protein
VVFVAATSGANAAQNVSEAAVQNTQCGTSDAKAKAAASYALTCKFSHNITLL